MIDIDTLIAFTAGLFVGTLFAIFIIALVSIGKEKDNNDR